MQHTYALALDNHYYTFVSFFYLGHTVLLNIILQITT
jgi:hypothetical protein